MRVWKLPRSSFLGTVSLIAGRTEEVLEVPLRGVEEIPSDLVVVRFMVGDLPDRIPIQAKEDRTRVAEENGRMRRDEKLRMPRCREVVDDLEERQLSLRRERGFRLVEQIQAGIVKGQLSIRTLTRSTSIRRRGAPVRVAIRRIFPGRGW